MKISQKIQQAEKENRVWWSFEYFPPRTAQVRIRTEVAEQSLTSCSGFAKPLRPYRAHACAWPRIRRYNMVSALSTEAARAPLTLFSRNAGGRTSDLTSELVKTCQGLIGVETCMHLTCTNMPEDKVDQALKVSEALSAGGCI